MAQGNLIEYGYMTNQVVDIILWAWIGLIMLKRVLCKEYKESNFNIFKVVFSNYFIADILLFIAAIIATVQFSNQFYLNITNFHHTILYRSIGWILFHKLITISILITYRNHQPKIFYEIKQEIYYIFNKI